MSAILENLVTLATLRQQNEERREELSKFERKKSSSSLRSKKRLTKSITMDTHEFQENFLRRTATTRTPGSPVSKCDPKLLKKSYTSIGLDIDLLDLLEESDEESQNTASMIVSGIMLDYDNAAAEDNPLLGQYTQPKSIRVNVLKGDFFDEEKMKPSLEMGLEITLMPTLDDTCRSAIQWEESDGLALALGDDDGFNVETPVLGFGPEEGDSVNDDNVERYNIENEYHQDRSDEAIVSINETENKNNDGVISDKETETSVYCFCCRKKKKTAVPQEEYEHQPIPNNTPSVDAEIELGAITYEEELQTEGVDFSAHIEQFEENPQRLRIEHLVPMGDPIGSGSTCTVYKALHMPMCNVYALKQTDFGRHDLLQKEMNMYFWFIKNIPSSSQLLQFYECFLQEGSGELMIVMDLMDLGSLADFFSVHNRKFTLEQIRHVARESLKGLQTLHSHNLIHRDIKPHNILLASDSSVKVADFGLVDKLNSPGDTLEKIQGTMKYFSPEKHQGTDNQKADIWAFGITIMELVLGDFMSDEDLSVFNLLEAEKSFTFNQIDRENLDPDLVDLLDCCLRINSDERPTTTELLKHPFITKEQAIPQFRSPIPQDQELNEIVQNLIRWINFCRNDEAHINPFPKKELHNERIKNLERWTKFHRKEILDKIRQTVQEEMAETEKLKNKMRRSRRG